LKSIYSSRFLRQIRAIWSETGNSLKIAWFFLWAVGLILLFLGEWGDSTGFWADRPFSTAVVSAMTGAAFGIPLALIILQRVAAAEADAAEARAARRLAVRISTSFASVATGLVDGGIPRTRAAIVWLEAQHRAVSAFEYIPLSELERVRRQSGSFSSLQRSNEFVDYTPHYNAAKEIGRYINQLFPSNYVQIHAELVTQWSILVTESRSRLLEAGEKWLAGFETEEIGRLIEATQESNLNSVLSNESTIEFMFSEFMDKGKRNIGTRRPPEYWMLPSWVKDISDFLNTLEMIMVKSDATVQFFKDAA
jgi:hypothetical protein